MSGVGMLAAFSPNPDKEFQFLQEPVKIFVALNLARILQSRSKHGEKKFTTFLDLFLFKSTSPTPFPPPLPIPFPSPNTSNANYPFPSQCTPFFLHKFQYLHISFICHQSSICSLQVSCTKLNKVFKCSATSPT